MKKIIIILSVALLSTSLLSAQNEEDALRYSRQYLSGTARSIGMGGAMGAIGGDFTSLGINPAGLGVYRKGEFTITPSVNWNTTESDFLGNKIDQTRYGVKISNIGYVFTSNTGNESGWVSVSGGIGYSQLNNFNQQIMMSGINNSSSFLDNFTTNLNNNSPKISEFYEGLAQKADLIEYVDTIDKYFNDFQRGGYGQEQQRTVSSSGSTGEYSFALGANYNHKLYVGATFGIQRVRYDRSIEHTETDQKNRAYYTEMFVFSEELRTRGYGANMKLGVIARPVDFIRLGFAYHTPTIYFLSDRFSNDIEAWFDPDLNMESKKETTQQKESIYQLKTPSKFIVSGALTFSKFGLVSIDYERSNYANAKLEGNDYGFIDENNAIKGNLKSTNNIRMGAEIRLGSGYVRGGYGIYGSPLKIVDPEADFKYSVISGGIGVRSSDFFLDLGYSSGISKEAYYMYVPEMTTGSINKSNLSNVVMTLGFRF